jgi:hypothetical protein
MIPEFSWRDWGEPQKTPVRKFSVPTEIRTGHLPKTSEKQCRLKQVTEQWWFILLSRRKCCRLAIMMLTRSLQLLWMHEAMPFSRSRTESWFLPLFLDARHSPTHPSCPPYRPTMHHLDRFCFIRLDGFLSNLTSLCIHWNTAQPSVTVEERTNNALIIEFFLTGMLETKLVQPSVINCIPLWRNSG